MWCKIDFPLSLKLHTELQHPFKHQTQTPPHTQNKQNTINYTITSVFKLFAIFITNFYPPFFHCTICFRFSLRTRKLLYNFTGLSFSMHFCDLKQSFCNESTFNESIDKSQALYNCNNMDIHKVSYCPFCFVIQGNISFLFLITYHLK